MVSIVDIFGWEEIVWKVESIKFFSGSVDVILYTITIGIKNWSTSSIDWTGCSISLIVREVNSLGGAIGKLEYDGFIIISSVFPLKWVSP